MKCIALGITILLFALKSDAQDTATEKERIRREKLEEILRIKDLRTPNDGALIAALSDDDSVVQREATLACGSLQDTALLGELTRNLTASDPGTQGAATFALGQTGIRLGEKGKKELEHNLIWNQLPRTLAAGRLIEEIGKFGTEEALNDLVIRIGNVPPVVHPTSLMMSIARFAIRGIITADAVRFLIRYIQPGESTPWQAVYALERIGSHPETLQQLEAVRLLCKHHDPLIRMNAVSLLGKLHDEGGSSNVIQQLADHDIDWRVRVNAFKALGRFTWKGNTAIVLTFKRAFFDANEHVSITALSMFPQTGVDGTDTTGAARETLRQLAYIAENAAGGFHRGVQAEAALGLVRLDGNVPKALRAEGSKIYPKLRARLLQAAGEFAGLKVREILFLAVNEEEPAIVGAALEGLQALAHHSPERHGLIDSIYAEALRVLTRRDVVVATTAASLLGDSLFRRASSVDPLVTVLGSLHPPGDTEEMQEIIATLGKLGDTRAVSPLLDHLGSLDPSVALGAAAALQALTGNDYGNRIIRKNEPLYVDMDFAYLRALPPVVRVKLATSKGEISIDLFKESAPFTVMNILKLAEQRGFFRGLLFHRVVPNFVVQGGDPRGDGWGGPGFAIRSEFSMLTFERGTVGMASAGKDTEGSQFFITHSPQPHLDGRYTIFGKVVSGMDVVNKLQVDDRIYDVTRSP